MMGFEKICSHKKLLSLFFLITFFVICFSFPQPDIPKNIGVNVHFLTPPAGVMDILSNLSVSYVRMDLQWNVVEPSQKGVYDFKQYDVFINACTQRGITPYLIFDYSNKLYDDDLSPHTDEGREGFANFALACVERYQGKGIIFEIYNEPNIKFWRPEPNVDDYCKMANVLLDKVKGKFPKETIVGPATSGIDLKFIEACIKCGMIEKVDAISVHPYGNHPPEKVSVKYKSLRELLKVYKLEDKPLLSGEWGFNDIEKHMDVQKQGQMVSRQWAANIYNGISLSIWYDLHDDGTNKTWGEDHFGLVYYDYSPKPAFYSAKAFNTLLKGYTFKFHHQSYEFHHVLDFSNGTANAHLAWTTLKAGKLFHININVGKGSCFRLFNFVGTFLGNKCGDEKGIIAIPEEEGITYLVK